jgi:hypothetical protein
MKERNILSGIVILGFVVLVGLGAVTLILTRTSDTDAPEALPPESPPISVVDIETVYDPYKAGDPVPEGYRQLLGRDQIEPIYDPVFTTADQVDWPGEMLVVGVASGDAAKAYPITHLNQHEMVIDHIDGSPILVSW